MEQSSSSESATRQNQSRSDSRPRSLYSQAKKYMKQETISFFGVNERIEAAQQEKWIERRKRLALRKYGSLKDDIPLPRSFRDSFNYLYSQSRDGYGSRPDILPDERDETDAGSEWLNISAYKKPSVFQMTYRGIAYLVTTLTRRRPRTPERSRHWSRSYAPSDVPMVPQVQRPQSLSSNEVFFSASRPSRDETVASPAQDEIDSRAGGDFGSSSNQALTVHPIREAQIPSRSSNQSWQRGRDSPGTAGPEVGSSRIDSNFLGRAFDNSNRRQYGMGILGRLFGRKMKKSVSNQARIKEQLDDLDDYRPYFTYWVTTVQVVILFISLFTYGFGPPGIDLNRRSGLVSCLDDVCGMIPFYVPDHPDQFYRLWTSLFLHAGIVHMAVTLLIQLSLMRDLEKLTGPLRIGIIYLGSGVAGNLASAIFVPYRAEVGPAGSQFGLLACLVVEVLNVWPMLQRPENALMKLLGIVLVLFLFGLLPWIDNYAHFFGFVFGFLLSYAFLPFVSFGPYDRTKKVTLIWICLFSAGIVFGALVVLFYIVPIYECQVCNYFNCIPLTRDFCAEQNINFIKNVNTGDVV
ncbi:rhomboid, putative [Pediculus humanus corporis]|uniref:Rhomboid, putative n=1 Tax=Pediculus humanus subsp. corporis TaxID=121224 RepID=E0VN59_PEDHC|nr:rhomboid, putative [Pediculus humanus corporis]EEB14779.1 rhomboid, putative [Pediculus humanus corporis]